MMGFWVGSIRRILLRWYFLKGQTVKLPGCKRETFFFFWEFLVSLWNGASYGYHPWNWHSTLKNYENFMRLKISRLPFWEGPCSAAFWLVVKQYFFFLSLKFSDFWLTWSSVGGNSKMGKGERELKKKNMWENENPCGQCDMWKLYHGGVIWIFGNMPKVQLCNGCFRPHSGLYYPLL